MAPIIYLLCGVTSLICMLMLFRAYFRTRNRLLLWFAIGFVSLAFNNVLVFFDLVLVPEMDMSLWRVGSALIGYSILAFGMIWETV
jgi:hypothetical protein